MSNAVTRCKVRVNWVSKEFDKDKNQISERVTASAVYSDDPNSENKQWSTMTPSFSLDMTINNPGAFGNLASGHEFYVDFIPATDEQAEVKSA
jgi:hypothetical protein